MFFLRNTTTERNQPTNRFVKAFPRLCPVILRQRHINFARQIGHLEYAQRITEFDNQPVFGHGGFLNEDATGIGFAVLGLTVNIDAEARMCS